MQMSVDGTVYFTRSGVPTVIYDVGYPALYSECMAIGASTAADIRSAYSQFDDTLVDVLDVVAPSSGGNWAITTTDITGSGGYSSGNYTSGFGGTSSATPLAAGIAALVLSKNPDLTPSEVEGILESSADEIGCDPYSGHYNEYYGQGRVNAAAALLATFMDCNNNGVPDDQDISGGTSDDCNANGIPDECDPDADGDGVPDDCDICAGFDDSLDADGDGVPDGCDICIGDDATGDCDGDGICDDTDPCDKPVLTGAVSRKTHMGAGDWDINVGDGDIECRSAQVGTANPNELLIVATFDIDVGLMGYPADVTSDTGTVTGVQPGSAANELEITLTDLTFNTQINMGFGGVVNAITPGNPTYVSNSTLCVRVIVGDYDNMGRTNYTDFAKIKNALYINQLVDMLDKARADFDCSGRPNYTDFARVKNAGLLNQTAPACPVPPIGP